jgi:hypothetical protein
VIEDESVEENGLLKKTKALNADVEAETLTSMEAGG